MDDTDDDLPEVLQLHKALAVACLALELIAHGDLPGSSTATAALNHLRRRHPVAREYLDPDLEPD